MSKGSTQTTTSYPLSAVFYIVAVAAILFSLVAPIFVVGGNIDYGDLVAWMIVLAILGMFLGALIGLYHYRRRRGVGWGMLVGIFTGAFLGPIVVADNFEQVTMSCLIGSGILVLLTAFIRISSKPGRPT